MQKLQQGFTLIELMIVVAIIGILAALAVPAYQDYTIRTKVGEAASLAGAARTAVDVWFSETGTLTIAEGKTPEQRAVSLGISQPASYDAKYVASVAVAQDGRITVTMDSAGESGLPTTVAGQTVIYEPRRAVAGAGNLEWAVSATPSTVPDKYLPRR